MLLSQFSWQILQGQKVGKINPKCIDKGLEMATFLPAAIDGLICCRWVWWHSNAAEARVGTLRSAQQSWSSMGFLIIVLDVMVSS